EGRDVEALGYPMTRFAGGVGRQDVVVAFTPGRVADFTENRRQAVVGVKAVEQADRIEGQAPAAWLGEQADAPLRRVSQGFADPLAYGVAQGHALAGGVRQVVGFAKGEGGPARTPG